MVNEFELYHTTCKAVIDLLPYLQGAAFRVSGGKVGVYWTTSFHANFRLKGEPWSRMDGGRLSEGALSSLLRSSPRWMAACMYGDWALLKTSHHSPRRQIRRVLRNEHKEDVPEVRKILNDTSAWLTPILVRARGREIAPGAVVEVVRSGGSYVLPVVRSPEAKGDVRDNRKADLLAFPDEWLTPAGVHVPLDAVRISPLLGVGYAELLDANQVSSAVIPSPAL